VKSYQETHPGATGVPGKTVAFRGAVDPTMNMEAVAAAGQQVGVPYKFATESAGKSFDCSGLIQWSYAQMGVKIPRDTYGQIKAGVAVKSRSINDLIPGDLIFPTTHHVVMYVGDGKVIAAPHTGEVVQYQDVGMFWPPVAVRRIVRAGTAQA